MSNISAYIILIIAVALGTASNGFAKSAQGFTLVIVWLCQKGSLKSVTIGKGLAYALKMMF